MVGAVLLVANDANTSHALARAIHSQSAETEVIRCSGNSNIERILRSAPAVDAALIDMKAPVITLGQTIRQIKRTAERTVGELPVTALLWFGDTEREEAAIDAGVDDILLKPISAKRLQLALLTAARLNVICQERLYKPAAMENHTFRMHDGVGGNSFSHLAVARTPEISAVSASSVPLLDAEGKLRKLRQMEAEMIRFALMHYHGKMAEIARSLGIGRSTLYRKIDELGITPMRESSTPSSE